MHVPIAVVLHDGELSGVDVAHARRLGRATAKLSQHTPRLPTLRDMHRNIAARPHPKPVSFSSWMGVRLTERCCAQDAIAGELSPDPVPSSKPPHCTSYDDDYATNGDRGLAIFAADLCSPLEALGRGIPVVTANKQLVARHGSELFAAADAAGALGLVDRRGRRRASAAAQG